MTTPTTSGANVRNQVRARLGRVRTRRQEAGQPEGFLARSDIAEIMDVHPTTVDYWAKIGVIRPSPKRKKRPFLYDESELKRILAFREGAEEDDDLLSTSEVARRLGVSRQWAQELFRRYQISPVRRDSYRNYYPSIVVQKLNDLRRILPRKGVTKQFHPDVHKRED